jgi:hypothetical protein
MAKDAGAEGQARGRARTLPSKTTEEGGESGLRSVVVRNDQKAWCAVESEEL